MNLTLSLPLAGLLLFTGSGTARPAHAPEIVLQGSAADDDRQADRPAKSDDETRSNDRKPDAQKAGIDAIDQARAALRAAEVAHPGNSVEICEALENLIGLLLDAHMVDDQTLALAKRGVAVAQAGPGHDGKGVLGLQRAFRVAGVRSVIMTLWPVDDGMSRRYMHELYAERFGRNATTADAVWNASRKLLADRRAAGLCTHPWYWAGFVGSGSWE